MENDVNSTIDAAVIKMADKARVEVDANKALHFSQSALNLANTKATLFGCKAAGSSESSKKTS
jgi:hypothetical protein